MKNKTTKKDFELFRAEVQKWLGLFGLHGWDVDIEHEEVLVDCLATCSRSELKERTATIALSPNWSDYKVTDEQVKRSAFHEVMELLFTRIDLLARDRFVQEREIREEIHNLIRIMENLIFDES